VPELNFDDGRPIAELLRDARPVLLDLSGAGVAAAASGWAHRVDIISASITDPPAAAILIRPDGYIAWAADTYGPAHEAGLLAALRRWFGPEPSRLDA
jgi:hypothetical protein